MHPSSLSIQALFLGILQGLTEFLPISSSAHLILVPWFFHWQNSLVDSLLFDVALHAGTLLAILGYFWRDWLALIRGFFRTTKRGRANESMERMVFYILLATLPAAFLGLLLEKSVEKTFRDPILILGPLVVVSGVMIWAERRKRSFRNLDQMNLAEAMIIGFAQALALFPGASRSGITITTGLLRGFRREEATRFSFLLSTPAIAGAAVLQFRHLIHANAADWPILAVGFFASALVGYLAIAFLMRYLRVHTLNVFAVYRLLLAAVIIIWVVTKG